LSKRRFLLFFALILALRVGIAARFRGNFDTQSFLIVVQAVQSGQNVYAATDRYNYSPLWSYVVTGLWRLATPNVGVFVLLLGLLQIAADSASTLLLIRIGRRRLSLSPEEARRRSLLFFSNPVSVLVSCAHGQFDGLAILFLLAALVAAASPESLRRAPRVAALLSLSLLVKHVALFHPLLFSRRRERGVLSDGWTLAPYAVLAGAFLPYAAAFGFVAKNILVYGARASQTYLQKPGGLPSLIDASRLGRWTFSVALLAAVVWILRETRHLELSRACLVVFLAQLTFSPAYAVQYLVWPVALGSLFPTAAYGLFALAGGLYHSSAPESLNLAWPIRTTELGTWAAGAIWLASEILNARRERVGPAADWISRA
jgi:hypothetical protein